MKELIVRTSLIFTVLLVLGWGLLVAAAAFPSIWMRDNIGKSIQTLKQEGIYPSFGAAGRQIVLDNFTDALILDTAYSLDAKQPFWSSLNNPRSVISVEETNQIENLENKYLNGPDLTTGYERYWHGYLIYVKPLLLLFPYSQIRVLLSVCLIACTIYLFRLLKLRAGSRSVIIVAVGLLAVDFLYLGQSLQFSAVFLVGLVTSIVYLKCFKKQASSGWLFLVNGCLTAYFDLLTAPFVALGILLVVTQLVDEGKGLAIKLGAWAGGYAGFWAMKWILVSLLYNRMAWYTAVAQVLNRTQAKADANFSQISAVVLNLKQLIGYARLSQGVWLILIILLATTLFIYHKRKLTAKLKTQIKYWVITGLLPLAWFLLAANHSYLHVWYTYRDQFLTVASIMAIWFLMVDTQRIKTRVAWIKARLKAVFGHEKSQKLT